MVVVGWHNNKNGYQGYQTSSAQPQTSMGVPTGQLLRTDIRAGCELDKEEKTVSFRNSLTSTLLKMCGLLLKVRSVKENLIRT